MSAFLKPECLDRCVTLVSALLYKNVWSISLQVRFFNCFDRSGWVREAVASLTSNSRIHILNRAPCLGFLRGKTKQMPHKRSRKPPGEALQTLILIFFSISSKKEEASKRHKWSLIKSDHLSCAYTPVWRQDRQYERVSNYKPKSSEG